MTIITLKPRNDAAKITTAQGPALTIGGIRVAFVTNADPEDIRIGVPGSKTLMPHRAAPKEGMIYPLLVQFAMGVRFEYKDAMVAGAYAGPDKPLADGRLGGEPAVGIYTRAREDAPVISLFKK